jgi:hypothetical protein
VACFGNKDPQENTELVIVPHGRGYCIMNEELFVTNATDDQSKVALRTPTPAAMLPPAPPPTPVPVEVSPQVAYIDDAMKQQMVEGLSAQTGMNMYLAKKMPRRMQLGYSTSHIRLQ